MATQQTMPIEITWDKQPRQMEFLMACGQDHPFKLDKELDTKPQPPAADTILYGGAAGGGKSDALIVLGIIAACYKRKLQVGYFRREFPQLEGPGGAIMRSKELLAPLMNQGIVKWNGSQHRWTFANGSVFQFCHAKNEDDVYSYQSQQFDLLLLDESTHFTEFQIRYLQTRNRATVKGWVPFTAMATNPGHISHGYHKRHFIDVGPPGQVHEVEVQPGVYAKHLFIPAFLQDNIALEQRDPYYRQKLQQQPADIRKALLEGDWTIFAGQYFREWRQHKHVMQAKELPKDWFRFAAMDWGYAAPCAVYWLAVDPAMGRVFVYREIYVTEMRAQEVARLFMDLSQDEEIAYVKASPDMWHERGLGAKVAAGESIAEVFLSEGVPLDTADNRRVMGWNRIRDYLTIAPDGHPWLIVFDNCTELIRTLPELIHDEKKVEDVDEQCEDHGPEALRYGLMSRPSPVSGSGEDFLPGGYAPKNVPTRQFPFRTEENRDEWEDEDIESDAPGFFG